MTQDEIIIAMALEAGFDVDEGLFPFEAVEDKYIGTERTLEAFIALVAAHEREKVLSNDESLTLAHDVGYRKGQIAEREACAKVCDDAAPEYEEGKNMAVVCAAAIRARS